MSKRSNNRDAAGKPSGSPRSSAARVSGGRARTRPWKWWCIGAVLILAAFGTVRLLMRPSPPALPAIATTGLEANASALLQRHLDDLRMAPRSGAAWGKLGAILKAYGFREQAGHCLAEAERLDRTEPRWPYLHGALRAGDSTVFALARFRRAVALCGNEPEMPRLRLARRLAETGRENEGREELRQLLKAKPGSGPARLLMAQFHSARGEWTEALALASGCVTNPHTARAAWTLLASLHQRRGDTNAAVLAGRRAGAVTPDVRWPDPFEEEITAMRGDASSLSSRAQSLLMAGRPADALPLIQRLVREHPTHSQTWLLLGRAQNLQNQPGAAEQSLRRFLQLEPASVNGHFQLGMSLLAQQRFPEAVATFRQAIALKPDFGPAFFNLAFALVKSGQPRDAVTAFREAIRHNPEKVDSYILLADLQLQFGDKAEVLRLAEQAQRIESSDPRLAMLRAKIQRE